MLVALLAPVPSLSGCRVSSDDVEAWAHKKSGPKKLAAVLTHEKYPLDIRIDAAMTLATMPSRSGQAVGLVGSDESPGLLSALESLPSGRRAQILEGMLPRLKEGIVQAPKEDGHDDSLPAKDAAFALLTQNDGRLVADPAVRAELESALGIWAQTSFERRFEDTSQLYGMEQVLRLLRTKGVTNLPQLMTADFKHLAAVAKLIRELGDNATQLEASKKLVSIAESVDSPAWREAKSKAVQAANEASGLKVTEKQLEKQLEIYQEEELLRIFGAMKNVGQAPITGYLIGYAKSTSHPEKRRAAALAGLEGNLDRKNPEHAKFVLDLLSDDDAPDSVRDGAARRVGELSRDQVASRLYSLFNDKRWQVRWTAASLLLKMSEAKDLPEFMNQLGKIKSMALSEPLAYGPLLQDVKGEAPETIVARYSASSFPAPVRLTAFGYYYRYGDARDANALEAHRADKERVPPCPPNAEACDWRCSVSQTAEDGKASTVLKDVKTVGEYVEYCILPGLKQRSPAAASSPSSGSASTEEASPPKSAP